MKPAPIDGEGCRTGPKRMRDIPDAVECGEMVKITDKKTDILRTAVTGHKLLSRVAGVVKQWIQVLFLIS